MTLVIGKIVNDRSDQGFFNSADTAHLIVSAK